MDCDTQWQAGRQVDLPPGFIHLLDYQAYLPFPAKSTTGGKNLLSGLRRSSRDDRERLCIPPTGIIVRCIEEAPDPFSRGVDRCHRTGVMVQS